MLAPICLFTYNRLTETQQTIKALQKNLLAPQSDLIIFSDGPKNEKSKIQVDAIRKYIKSIEGFKSVKIIESRENKGLATSIIHGISDTINEYGKVIALEDDLLTSSNFLNFMNEALDYHFSKKKIFSISGYTLDLPSLKTYKEDYYLGYRASSWGWGTWKDRWVAVDWEAKGWKTTIYSPLAHIKFMNIGSDMPYMLWKQMNGKIDSWAIRWCYYQFKNNLLTVFPTKSKIKNIGFGENATHTKKTKRFLTMIDTSTKIKFQFHNEIYIEKQIIKEFKYKSSILNRLKDKFI